MSLLIYLAHTGGRLQADRNSFTSVDELKRWIEQNVRLPTACQILMTARGTNVKSSSLSNERELFLYDRKQLELSTKPRSEPIPKIQTPSPFPDDLESETDMSSWRLLFKKRKSWAESVLAHAQSLAPAIQEAKTSSKTMQRAVSVAFSNLDNHSSGLGASLDKLQVWAAGIMQDRDRLLKNWEPAVKRLARIPVHEEFKAFGPKEKPVKFLLDFVDVKEVQSAAATSGMLAEKFDKDVSDLAMTIEEIRGRTSNLKADIQQSSNEYAASTDDELQVLLKEIDVLVNKVRTDNEYVRGLQGAKSVSTASKRAYASTVEYLPGLIAVINDIGKLLQIAVERKNTISGICLGQLQNIAVIQSMSAPVNPQINNLDASYQEEGRNFELLSLVLGLPSAYGSLLVECIRRREWSERFSNNSQRLAEELAQMKEDEEKRRRKWQRNTGALLPFEISDSSQIVRAELNTRGDASGGLPRIAREDVEKLISLLKSIEGMESVVKEVTQAYQDLDRPSKRLNKRLKGFKLGSVHDLTMSSSFFNRNDDEVKLLKADKETLSERIKGYESRIRKLEDLLHRGRTNSGNVYQVNSPTPQPPPTPTPGQQNFSQTSQQSTKSPEQAKDFPEASENFYTDKIASLEAELAAERDRITQLQKETSAKEESEKAMNDRISQADDTKKDLVKNLEETVREHVNERKALQKEISDLRHKLEEAEEEIDRFEDDRSAIETREHENERLRGLLEKETENLTSTQERERQKDHELSALKEELDSTRKRLDEEEQRSSEAEAALAASEQNTTRLVENVKSLEQQLRETRSIVDSNSAQHAKLVSTLKQAYSHLSADGPPEDLNALTSQVEYLISTSTSRNKELELENESRQKKLASLEKNNDRLQARLDSRTTKAKDLTQRLYTHNMRSIQLLESLGYRIVRGEDSIQIIKVSRSNSTESTVLSRNTHPTSPETTKALPAKSPLSFAHSSTTEDINLLYWMETEDSDVETEKYSDYLKTIGALDLDAFSEAVTNRVKKAEQDARQLMKQGRAYREKYYRARDEASEKIAFKSFKQGDLALFLPTRNQVTRPWAAFNIGAPHYFLREQDQHMLATRDWLVARISKVEDRVVDLSRSAASVNLPHGIDRSSIGGNSSDGGFSFDDENPFELSDGLRWYLLDAVEEKPGAPSTPGLSSSTVASANVDAAGSLRSRKPVNGAKKKLSEITTEHSRRSSSSSNRNSAALSSEAVAAVRAAVENGEVGGSVIVDPQQDAPETPRTPVGVEKLGSRLGMKSTGRVV